ncbi:MAG TPA: tetratricopeptide repeat protein [Acidobacteriaceae bacterium]|nr:tetratricopeptide repeat protein [Acidobacteriaceae bacterium]
MAQAARDAYNAKKLKNYRFPYGPGKTFLPSNFRTDDGQFIDPKSYPTAEYCGHCHQAALLQWRQSAHSNSVRPPWYQRNVNLLDAEKGIPSSRHCEGCHNPLALAAGDLTDGVQRVHSYDQDGITCSVCHSIQSVDTRGTGSFVLGAPAVLLDENGQPIERPVQDAEILAHLDRHSAAVMKPFYRTSEYCAACHKAALPRELNDYKWLRAISLYDEWQNSSYSKESPLPFYEKPLSTCQTCHMPREPLGATRDYGAKKGELASHRWLGANTIIPQYYSFDEQAKRIVEFLQNNVFNLDIFALETGDENNSTLIASLGKQPFTLRSGEHVVLTAVLQNKGIAHSHVPEQRDMYESWVDFQLKDRSGKILCESGYLAPDGELNPEAHSFTNRLINKQGTLNDLHQVWDNRVTAFNNTIQAGRSQLIRYGFSVPASQDFTVEIKVRYRRFDQHFMDFGMSKPMGEHYHMPVVDMVSTTRTFHVGDNPATAPSPTDNPEWMRWNNYGIGLLDAQQYAASVAAFEHVAELRKDYADAQINVGLAYIQWEKYDDALSYLNKGLELAQGDDRATARALYYIALVQRNQGNVDDAIVNLKKVADLYPRSRDAQRELGFSYYQLHRYHEAEARYLMVQAIDPDDLAAHYNLAILYRRLGMKDKAAAEAAYFADEKDDPTAITFALQYLRKNNEVARETNPWHVHELMSPAASADKKEQAALVAKP